MIIGNVLKEMFIMEMQRKTCQTPILDNEKNGVRYLQFPALMKPEVCRHLFLPESVVSAREIWEV